jgi:ribosomal protein S18 acetylase RimI-like enzyme
VRHFPTHHHTHSTTLDTRTLPALASRALASSELELKYATAEDAPGVVTLVESAYRGQASRAGWTTEADLLDGQRTDIEEVLGIVRNAGSRLILARHGGTLVGCVHVHDEGQGTAYVGMVAIRPDQQAMGIGRQLLERAELCAKETFAATKTRMTVIIQREELIRWYERRGYRRTDRREPFPYGDPRFGLPKREDLEFIVLEKSLGA